MRVGTTDLATGAAVSHGVAVGDLLVFTQLHEKLRPGPAEYGLQVGLVLGTFTGLQAAIQKKLDAFPGIIFNYTQPAEDAVDEAETGLKSSLAVKIFGSDLQILETKAEKLVIIRADTEVDYGTVMAAMDQLRTAGIEDIGLITDPTQTQTAQGGKIAGLFVRRPKALLLLATFDLWVFGHAFHPRVKVEQTTGKPAWFSPFMAVPGGYRTAVLDRRIDPTLDIQVGTASLGLLWGISDVLLPSPLLILRNDAMLALAGMDVGDRGEVKVERYLAHQALAERMGVAWVASVGQGEPR